MSKSQTKPLRFTKGNSTYIIYKPYGMLSQFSKEIPTHITLADLEFEFEKNVYPVGRLDADSEGLLLLTNDKNLNARLLDPQKKIPKTYWAQVEGIPTKENLNDLKTGVEIRIKKKSHLTAPAIIELLDSNEVEILPERNPPIRVRKSIPTSWIALTLTEGKNRQVRRMCAAVGLPVLRLVRIGLATYTLGKNPLANLSVGEVKEITTT